MITSRRSTGCSAPSRAFVTPADARVECGLPWIPAARTRQIRAALMRRITLFTVTSSSSKAPCVLAAESAHCAV